MALLSIANLILSFGSRRILDGVNLTLDPGQHVGMVGRNGCGKSTLLKLIAGLTTLKPDAGQVQIARNASTGYLTQDPDLDPECSLRDEAASTFSDLHRLHQQLENIAHQMESAQGEELEKLLKRYEKTESKIQAADGYTLDHRIDATLHGLGLTDAFFNVKVKDLSGGQKGRLALAKLLLRHPDVLLLDEPTNHLDIAGREWLEQYLANYSGAVILVSHDRWLLDRVVERIYELEDGALVEYPGNYQAYREQRVLRRLAQQRQYEKQAVKIRQEQAFIDRYRAGQRASQAQGREKRLERYKETQLIDRPSDLDDIGLAFRPAQRCGDLVITAEQLSKAYDGKALFDDLTVQIKRGDRIGIIGPNGAGKSTLIRTLLGEQPPDGGTTRVGNAVNVGHYRQTHEGLDLSRTVVQYLQTIIPSGLEQDARNLAGAFLFSGTDQDKPLSVLSGGERSRAVLAGLMAHGHNLLVLDEPTNHLDIPSAERLEAALKSFTAEPKGYSQGGTTKNSTASQGGSSGGGGGGTLILITHDRMLLEDLVDQIIVLDGEGNAKLILGTYSQYIATQQSKPSPISADLTPQIPRKTRVTGTTNKQSASPKVKSNSSLAKLNQQSLEKKIEGLETKIADTDTQLADPDTYRDPQLVKQLQSQREQLAADLAPFEAEWLRRAEV